MQMCKMYYLIIPYFGEKSKSFMGFIGVEVGFVWVKNCDIMGLNSWR